MKFINSVEDEFIEFAFVNTRLIRARVDSRNIELFFDEINGRE